MREILTFLSDYDKLISLISFVFMAVFAVLLYRKTGNIKYLEEVFQEMKYRTPNYQDTEQVSGQEFTNLKPVYKLNKVTNTLEMTDEVIDIDELVRSSLSSALDVILDKYLPAFSTTGEIGLRTELQDDLDVLQDMHMRAEELRDKYRLSSDLSVKEVYDFVQTKYNEVTKQIDEKTSKKEIIKSEVLNNEKENVEESKQA